MGHGSQHGLCWRNSRAPAHAPRLPLRPQLQATLIGSSTNDTQLRSVLILPGGEHAKLTTAEAYAAFLRSTFPSLPEDTVQVGGGRGPRRAAGRRAWVSCSCTAQSHAPPCVA